MPALLQFLVICAVVCCYFPGFTEMNNDFAIKPRNRTALENSMTTLKCASNRSSGVNGTMSQDWAFTPINGVERTLSPDLHSISYNRSEPGQNDLIIRKTSFQDAGTYRCVSSSTQIKLNVLYSSKNITFSPPGERFYPGDIITCSMDSNPKAEYFWTNLTSGRRFSKLKINESHISSMIHRIHCTATVNISERNISWVSSQTLDFMVNEKNSNTGIWIALAIAGVGLLIAFIVAIILIRRKILKKTQTGNTSKNGKVRNSEIPVTSYNQMVYLDAHLYDEIAIATDNADARESLQLPNGDVLQPYGVIRDHSDQNKNNWTFQYVGKDGTVYTVLRSNQSTDGTGSNPPSKEKQNFPTAVYANIAHDLEVSPPP